MSTTTGVSLEELKRQRAALIAQGKELSTSKELGKIEQAIKVLQPDKYDAAQVASAQQNLKLINEPVVSGPGGATMPGTSSGASSGSGGGGSNAEVSALEKQLLDKQTALDVATKNLNDNPWYSEATRVGKLAKLNNIAQLEIGNIQNALSQKKQDFQQAFSNQMATQQFSAQQQQQAFSNNITTQELALRQQAAIKPAPAPKPTATPVSTKEVRPAYSPLSGEGTVSPGGVYIFYKGWWRTREELLLMGEVASQVTADLKGGTTSTTGKNWWE